MNNTVTRPVSGADKKKSKHPAVWREEWVAVIYLLGTGGWGGRGMGTVEGRGKGKHDLAPMVSMGAHAKGNPPTTTTQPA